MTWCKNPEKKTKTIRKNTDSRLNAKLARHYTQELFYGMFQPWSRGPLMRLLRLTIIQRGDLNRTMRA